MTVGNKEMLNERLLRTTISSLSIMSSRAVERAALANTTHGQSPLCTSHSLNTSTGIKMVSATEVLFASSDLAHRVLAHLSPGDLPVDAEPDSAIAQEWMEDARTLARLARVNRVVSKIALYILWRQTEIQLLLCLFPTYNSETLVSHIIDKLLPNLLF